MDGRIGQFSIGRVSSQFEILTEQDTGFVIDLPLSADATLSGTHVGSQPATALWGSFPASVSHVASRRLMAGFRSLRPDVTFVSMPLPYPCVIDRLARRPSSATAPWPALGR